MRKEMMLHPEEVLGILVGNHLHVDAAYGCMRGRTVERQTSLGFC